MNYTAKTFDELATPLSRNKVFLLVEVTDPVLADSIEHFHSILHGLGISEDFRERMEDYWGRGYLVAEAAITDQAREQALCIVDYFRQRKLRGIIKVFLFVNEQLIEHSHDGLPSSYDLLVSLSPGCYATR